MRTSLRHALLLFPPFVVLVGLGCSSSSDDATALSSKDATDAGASTTDAARLDGAVPPTSDAGAHGDGGTSGPGSTAGWTVADDLVVQIAAICVLPNGQPLSGCSATHRVIVDAASTNMPVADATVAVSLDGQAPTTMTYGGGVYTTTATTFATTYHYEITHGSDHVVVLATAPGDFALTLPATTTAETATTLSWTPAHDAFTNMLTVTSESADPMAPGGGTQSLTDDMGSFSMPSTFFPHAGGYDVTLLKEQYVYLASPAKTGGAQFVGQIFHDAKITAQ